MSEQDLDTRIRALVARAVADAPPAPELDEVHVFEPHRRRPDRGHRGWWVGGGAAVLATAAAVVAVVVLVDDTEDRISTPATVPTTVPAPATTLPPETVPEPAPVPTPPGTTPGVTPEPAPTDVRVLTAGANGVVEHVGATTRVVTAEAMAIALDAGDGRVIAQRSLGSYDPAAPFPDAATSPIVIDGAGTITELFGTADWDGNVRIHDVEVVGGRRLLLFALAGPVVPQEANQDLYVADLDTGERTLVAEDVGGWEFGTGRLHLASTGLIVGEASAEVTVTIALYAVPGSAAATAGIPSVDGLGFESSDCAACPHAFTVAADGSMIAWIADEQPSIYALHIGSDGRFASEAFRLGASAPGGTFVADLDLGPAGALVSYGAGVDDSVSPPVALGWDGGTSVYDATTATFGPGTPGPVVGSEPTAPPTPTTSTTNPVPGPAPIRLATADADGVAVIEMGDEVRRLDQPAELALLTPGGAVVFQAPRPEPGGAAGLPQIWRPDGTIENLLSPAPAGQWYRLHDVASIDGIPVVLYGARTDGPAPEQYTEVVTALWMEPGAWRTEVVDEVPTWESGVSRLSLSSTGLIIGTRFESVSSGWYAAAVPGSPAADLELPGPPAGVEPTYGDCSTCPSNFTVSHDGESIVWTADGAMTVLDTASGDQRTWAVPALATDPFLALDARTSSDGGVEVAISYGSLDSEEQPPDAVVIATSPPGDVATSPVTARYVTFAP